MTNTSSLASAVLIVVAAFAVKFWKHTSHRDIVPEDPAQRRFLQWFHQNNGWLDAHLGLTSGYYDGYGSALTVHGDQVDKYNQILVVPQAIQISKESAITEFRRLLVAPELETEIQMIYDEVNQDEVIALALVIESCLGEHSFFEPYLNVLPKETLPLLFTFRDAELEFLQDEALAELARDTSARLHRVWTQMLEPSARVLVQRAMEEQGLSIHDTTAASHCLTQATFDRFYAISSSRSMILDGTKYLVPMADMINHHARIVDGNSKSKDENFESFHTLEVVHGSPSIVVHADRTTPAGGASQLLEEYGKLDNSLYVTSFGFVPTDNPYHCALLSAKYFPKLDDPVLLEILQQVDPSWETGGSACVHRDGSLLEHVPYLALYALDQSSGGNQVKVHRQICMDSYTSGQFDQETIERSCAGQGIAALLDATTKNKLLERAARTTLEMAATTLEQDLVILAGLEADSESGIDNKRKVLAVRFRIEEKQLTREIAGSLSDQRIDL
jgi:hypothetical protein